MAHKILNLNKAGKNRILGKRPVVRGVAMNPCDHPHGGGKVKRLHQFCLKPLEINPLSEYTLKIKKLIN